MFTALNRVNVFLKMISSVVLDSALFWTFTSPRAFAAVTSASLKPCGVCVAADEDGDLDTTAPCLVPSARLELATFRSGGERSHPLS